MRVNILSKQDILVNLQKSLSTWQLFLASHVFICCISRGHLELSLQKLSENVRELYSTLIVHFKRSFAMFLPSSSQKRQIAPLTRAVGVREMTLRLGFILWWFLKNTLLCFLDCNAWLSNNGFSMWGQRKCDIDCRGRPACLEMWNGCNVAERRKNCMRFVFEWVQILCIMPFQRHDTLKNSVTKHPAVKLCWPNKVGCCVFWVGAKTLLP